MYFRQKINLNKIMPMFCTFRRYITLMKFSFILKNNFMNKNEKKLNELMEIALMERGILYKILQHLFSDKIASVKVQVQELGKNKIISIIEKELNINFHDHFCDISEPVFCASIGQVHKAKLKMGLTVAIKIQYPGVKQSVVSQLKFLKVVASSTKFSSIDKWNITMKLHLDLIEKKILEELDYRFEQNNLLKAQGLNLLLNEKNCNLLEPYCTSKILTQPWIEGVDLNFIKNNWDYAIRKLVAEQLVNDYFKQIFVNGFFQGDTNESNFIIQETSSDIRVNWIDFGNWSSLAPEVRYSLFTLISQTIYEEDINYLGHFERIGFDVFKLRYLQNVLPILVTILFEPFLTNRPFDLGGWKLEERIDNLLGENKWWFRSSGNSSLLELIKSFSGVFKIVKSLNVNINWHQIFLKYSPMSDNLLIVQPIPVYENNIPTIKQLAKNLVIHILKDSREHAKIELPAISLLDLESFMPDDVIEKLIDKSFDLEKIKFSYLEKGLIPGDLFELESFENSGTPNSTFTQFRVYLT